MLLIQITAAQGPAECELAVKYTLQKMLSDAKSNGIRLDVVEAFPTQHGYLSIVLQAQGQELQAWAETWCGSIQWVFQSKIRPHHKRKNWFVGVSQCVLTMPLPQDDSIVFQACRASGSGGQHVNTTDSAIHATHIASGISVKVMTERSQYANKKLARELIALKLQQRLQMQVAQDKHSRHQQHGQLERGNPIRSYGPF
ncbi:putative peptide chain release factor H [Vitreoscilla sp. C1]|uniref:peptide chain release factor H n=1 Tax=Vitreoscilla sp. (strain C1) TaxID=96942 RepID=UPI000CDCDFA8|nr:peptide chain release factor H [Vitreoscilla sp. C1]AUZ05127.1 putative peptide chain release factor H [Vitreoscilla sp. C1]